MNTSGITAVTYGKVFVLWVVALTALAFGPFTALAQESELVVVGSTGTVDEADLAEYQYFQGEAGLLLSVGSGTVTYRYKLKSSDDFQDCSGCTVTVRITYRDAGATSNVQVRLRAASTTADGITNLYVFNSDANDSLGTPPPANAAGIQAFTRTFVMPAPHINPGQFAYFLEVDVTKTALPANPAFVAFTISRNGID